MKRLLIGIAALAALSACGAAPASDRQVASLSTAAANDTTPGTGDVTGTTVSADPQEAALQFAKCMREHGIDMPDPVVKTASGPGGETQVAIDIGGAGPAQKPNKKDMEAANKDCQHFMADAAGTFNPPSAEDQAKMQEQALAFAKCMREHGVDMPDPQFSGDGNFSIGFVSSDDSSNSGGPSFDPNSPTFKDANEACGQNGGGFSVSSGTVPG
jgi:hypothetical protein